MRCLPDPDPPARWRFGDRYDEVLDRLIGLTDHQVIEELLDIE